MGAGQRKSCQGVVESDVFPALRGMAEGAIAAEFARMGVLVIVAEGALQPGDF